MHELVDEIGLVEVIGDRTQLLVRRQVLTVNSTRVLFGISNSRTFHDFQQPKSQISDMYS